MILDTRTFPAPSEKLACLCVRKLCRLTNCNFISIDQIAVQMQLVF